MNFETFLIKSANDINTAIEAFFTTWSKESTQISPELKPLIDALHGSTADGKRIRGALILLGYRLGSGASVAIKKTDLLQIAVAYELFQTGILAHDDIIDKSPTRRGKPSMQYKLGGDHYGLSQAICLGDMGFFLTYKLVAESSFSDPVKTQVTAYLSKCFLDTVMGEMLDIAKGDVLTIYRLKTAYYTFVAPLTVGAILGGADAKVIEAIRQYGENLGIAFQIQDDIRDVFGTRSRMKKEIGGDIKEGKQTLLYRNALENADGAQKKLLQAWYGNEASGLQEIDAVRTVFDQTGAKKFAEEAMHAYCTKAHKAISDITSEKEQQTMLGEIIEYVKQ
jgi:geranylgeranyl diphosphate synthase type I